MTRSLLLMRSQFSELDEEPVWLVPRYLDSLLLFGCSGVFVSLRLRGLQHARLPMSFTISQSLLKHCRWVDDAITDPFYAKTVFYFSVPPPKWCSAVWVRDLQQENVKNPGWLRKAACLSGQSTVWESPTAPIPQTLWPAINQKVKGEKTGTALFPFFDSKEELARSDQHSATSAIFHVALGFTCVL